MAGYCWGGAVSGGVAWDERGEQRWEDNGKLIDVIRKFVEFGEWMLFIFSHIK